MNIHLLISTINFLEEVIRVSDKFITECEGGRGSVGTVRDFKKLRDRANELIYELYSKTRLAILNPHFKSLRRDR